MSIQLPTTKPLYPNFLVSNNAAPNNPTPYNCSDKITFQAKKNNNFLDRIRALLLTLPLALGVQNADAIIHKDYASSPSLPAQDNQPVLQEINQSPKPSDDQIGPVDNEYLRAIACLKDTTTPGGPGYSIDFSQEGFKVLLSLDKSEKPFITFVKSGNDVSSPSYLKEPGTTYEIDQVNGYIKYPKTLKQEIIDDFEQMYSKAIDMLLTSGQCDNHINNMTIE